MKPLLRIFAASLLLAALPFARAFEGKVSLAVTAERSGTMNMDYSFKGQKVRMDMAAQGHQMASITDMTKMETLLLMPDQQMYMVMSLKKPMEQAMEKAGAGTAEVEVTGKTETILGYKCNQIVVKDKGTTTEVWAAEGLGAFTGMGGGNPMAGMFGGGGGGGRPAAAGKWEEALKGKGGFPLRVISRDASGKQTFKMEATKVEAGSVPDAQFAPPAGYQKFDMPNMGGLLKGMGNE
jgi:hypothetical protein